MGARAADVVAYALVNRAALEPTVYRVLYAALALACVALVLAARQVYLLDLPGRVYQGAVLARLAGGEDAGAYGLQPYPVPNAFSTVFFALTVPALSSVGAGKAFVALYLAAAFTGAYALAHAADPATAARRAAVLAATLFVSSSFWNGYLNFQVGLLEGAAYAALWLRRGRPGPLVTGAFALLLFFTHAIPFAAFALAVGLAALRRRDLRTLAALMPSAGLTGWYILGRLGTAGVGFAASVLAPEGWGQALLYKGYTVLKLGPFQHFIGLDGRGYLEAMPALYWTLLVASAGFVAVLAVGLLGGVVQLVRVDEPRRRAAVFALVLFGGALLLPAFALNVINPGERLAACASLLLLAVTPLSPRLLTALALLAFGFLAYDVSYLATRLDGLPAPTRARLYADRVDRAEEMRAVAPQEHVEAFRQAHRYTTESLYSETRLKYLNHLVYFQAPLYEAVARGDFTLPSYNSGLLIERALPDP